MRVVAVHLLNDFSGSPKVLMQLLNSCAKKNIETHLYTCGGRNGFLSDIPKINTHFYWYRFANNTVIRLLFFTSSQLFLCLKLLFFLKKSDVLYVNTVLPFGAGIVGLIRGCKVIYHIHETSIKPKILKCFLFGVVKKSATEVIYVSNFLANQENMKNSKNVLYNVLEEDFVRRAQQHLNRDKNAKIVLMICSLKAYKGVNEFIKLAQMNLHITFKLVVNANQNDIDDYFKNQKKSKNLIVYPTQKDTHPFYQDASILVNLSDVNSWVETFGLTILEGMAYGLPAIVPPVGGVVELIEDGVNGYLIDSKKVEIISKKINELLTNSALYKSMSKYSIEKSKFFSQDYFDNEATRIIYK
ncbi:hypothetical protein AEM51_01665 [Bacteroidetes bacterium UKL13-3]|jgi:glycosyltransferase involved in cell wall biosynthesis|nr:hypothetical protein AEM51_01665 [Bacteroidetes bacterium UKL13-3]